QLTWDGCAVDLDDRPVAAVGKVAEPPGHELLPRPAFARYQDASIRRRHALDRRLASGNGRAGPDERRDLPFLPLRARLLHPAVLGLEAAPIERVPDGQQEPIQIGWFLDEVVCAELRRLRRCLYRPVARYHDHRQLGRFLRDDLQHLHAVALRHLDVEQHHVVPVLTHLAQGFFAVLRLVYFELFELQDLTQRPPDARLVVDY